MLTNLFISVRVKNITNGNFLRSITNCVINYTRQMNSLASNNQETRDPNKNQTFEAEMGLNKLLMVQKKMPTCLIDLRFLEELEQIGRIKGALHIPFEDLFYAFCLPESKFRFNYGADRPNKDTLIVLICRTHNRSNLAQAMLTFFGYPKCVSLHGGVSELKKIQGMME